MIKKFWFISLINTEKENGNKTFFIVERIKQIGRWDIITIVVSIITIIIATIIVKERGSEWVKRMDIKVFG